MARLTAVHGGTNEYHLHREVTDVVALPWYCTFGIDALFTLNLKALYLKKEQIKSL